MKFTRFFSIVALVVGFAAVSFSQENVAKALSPDNFATSNSNGIYLFEVPTGITAKDVALSAEYYTMYFTVAFNEKSHQAVITMKDMNDNAKHVIVRFFISLGLREIVYDGKVFQVEDFYQKYLKAK